MNLPAHLDLIAAAPDGIRKLRGLILELAVRGKLVPQNPNDEPASELLKRIARERARLEAEGICKKSKATPVVCEDEQPFGLPNGWEWVRLTHFGEFRGGKTPSTNRSEYWDGAIPWVSPKDMKSLVVAKTEDCVSDLAVAGGLSLIPAHSVLVVVRSGILRRTVPVAINDTQCTVNQDLKALCLTLPGMAQYVQLLVRGFERLILDTLTKVGTTVESIKFGEFSKQPFPLPPLAEQHRIVAKVDELMALCDRLEAEQTDADAAHARLVDTLLGTLTHSADAAELAANWQRLAEHFDTLFTSESSLDALKQTVLQLAVMGKLVSQVPDDEPASELLKRIAQERARLEADGTRSKSKPMPPVGADEKPFEIPEGWTLVRLGVLLSKIGAGSTPLGGKQVYVNEGIKFLRSQNVWNEGLRLSDVALIPAAVHQKMSGTHVEAGDLLFNITGASIGRCAVVPDSFDTGNVSQHVTIIRSLSKDILPFLHVVLISELVQRTVMDVQVGVSREGLSIGKLALFVIPLPPLPEQHRIVAKVDELLALVDRLKADLAGSGAKQERLAAALIESALQAA